jgi:hypothetical protein
MDAVAATAVALCQARSGRCYPRCRRYTPPAITNVVNHQPMDTTTRCGSPGRARSPGMTAVTITAMAMAAPYRDGKCK